MKAKIILQSKEHKGMTLYNEIFNKSNGLAYFELGKGWEVIDFKPFICTIKGIDLYEGDKVRVKGTKKVGEYETEIVRELQGWTLKENKTYYNDNKCFIAIIEKI